VTIAVVRVAKHGYRQVICIGSATAEGLSLIGIAVFASGERDLLVKCCRTVGACLRQGFDMPSFWRSRGALVAGGAGMIGSYLVDVLVREGANVRVVDNLEGGSLENLANCRSDIEFIQADLRDRATCRSAVQGVDAVFDLAAKTMGIAYSGAHHGQMLCESLLPAVHLLEAARQAGVGRFLVTSSSCVYPDDSPVPTPESAAERNCPESANEGYGWGKRVAELLAGYYARDGMQVVVARLANAYAPRYNWRSGEPHVIPAIIRRILQGEDPLVIWGSGRQTRSFIHAYDVAVAMKTLLEKAIPAVPVNIGPHEETPIAWLALELTAMASYSGRVVFDTSKPEGPPRKALDTSRLRQMLPDYDVSIALQDGLRETLSAARAFYGRK